MEHTVTYAYEVNDKMSINPKIVSMRCGDDCSTKYKKTNCLSNGKYCDMHSIDDEVFGARSMLENLFQYCIARETKPER